MPQRKLKLGWERQEVKRKNCKTCAYGIQPFGGPNCSRCGFTAREKYWKPKND